MNQMEMETEKCDKFTKIFYKQALLIIINFNELFFNKVLGRESVNYLKYLSPGTHI